MDQEMRDALAAGARLFTNRNRHTTMRPSDPYPDDASIALFRKQFLAFIEDMDGSMSLSELREQLEVGELE